MIITAYADITRLIVLLILLYLIRLMPDFFRLELRIDMKYNIRRIIFLIIAVVWAIVIFTFSAKPGDESEDQSIKVGMTVCHVFVPGFDNLEEYEQTAMAQKIDYPVRKTAHATEYAILAGLVIGAFTVSAIRWKNVLISVCISVLYAATDEFHQLFVPGRSGRITDVLIDGCGAFAGTLIIFGISRVVDMRRKKEKS